MLKVHSSRRVAGLKPTDYDHEISLVNQDEDYDGAARSGIETPPEVDMERINTESQLLANAQQPGRQASPRRENGHNGDDDDENNDDTRVQGRPSAQNGRGSHRDLRPSIEVQTPTPTAEHPGPHVAPTKSHTQRERETAIDILYENQRGGFLCGRPLFSSAALGTLDPPAWTNGFHKPSPTSIATAQVPDPAWEWSWPEWHINMQEGVDEGGWEYSFAYSKKFSWHRARWYNSFVRRRAWTRKRVKKKDEEQSTDPHMLNGDYFNVRPASIIRSHHSQPSLANSRVPSRTSLSGASSAGEMEQVRPSIDDIETLLQTLRFARIDREKLEATGNYLENALDLSQLHEEMHEIMALFVFQASRRLLLGHLMKFYDDTKEALDTNEDDTDLREKEAALRAALKHADEEVRRLAYWSDVKEMAEGGESRGAVDEDKGWSDCWQGADQSGPAPPAKGHDADEDEDEDEEDRKGQGAKDKKDKGKATQSE